MAQAMQPLAAPLYQLSAGRPLDGWYMTVIAWWGDVASRWVEYVYQTLATPVTLVSPVIGEPRWIPLMRVCCGVLAVVHDH